MRTLLLIPLVRSTSKGSRVFFSPTLAPEHLGARAQRRPGRRKPNPALHNPKLKLNGATRNWGHGLAVYMVLTGNLGVIPPGHDTRRTAVQLHHWREIAAVSGRACPQLQRCTSESFAAVCSGDNLPPLPLYSSTRMQYALSPSYMRLCSVPTRR
jgi:hypothetical protein